MCGYASFQIDQTSDPKRIYHWDFVNTPLTETVDIEADWIRLKHHPHSRFLSRDDVCTDYPFLRHWEVEKHFPNTDVR
jgi:hypothetical protein